MASKNDNQLIFGLICFAVLIIIIAYHALSRPQIHTLTSADANYCEQQASPFTQEYQIDEAAGQLAQAGQAELNYESAYKNCLAQQ